MKKIISLLSAFAIMSTLAVSVSAAGPTLTLSASATGYEKDDIVTVTCTYSGFEATPYDSSTGTGAKLNSYQTFVNIPGGIGTSSAGEQFVKVGSSITGSLNTGTLTPNFITADDQFSAVYYGGEDPLNGSGVLFTAQIKLLKPITADLAFTFDTVEESNIGYDLYEEDEYVDTILNPISGANLVGCTLKAPAGKGTQITEVVDGKAGYYLSNVPLSGLSQNTKFVIKYTGSDTVLNENGTKTEKRIQRNLGQILGGEFAVGTGVTGNLHFGIKLPTEKASEAVNFSVVTE